MCKAEEVTSEFNSSLPSNDLTTEMMAKIADTYSLNIDDYKELFQNDISARIEMEPFLILTIPKSGTNLISKLVSIITGMTTHDKGRNVAHAFPVLHFDYAKARDFFSKSRCKKIINIRDPRDLCVSATYWYETGVYPKAYLAGDFIDVQDSVIKRWYQSDFNQKIDIIINSDLGYPIGFVQQNLTEAVQLLQEDETCLVRFEDLVGTNGGGDPLSQRKTILKVAKFLNINLNELQIAFLIDNLYGKSPTFREGKIGSWETHFNQNNIDNFKRQMNQWLIFFNYENDDNWGSTDA